MPLHPEVKALLAQMSPDPDLEMPPDLTPAQIRAGFNNNRMLPASLEPVGRAYHEQIPVDGGMITLRVYEPAGVGPFPVVLWMHGGGWVVGSLEENDHVCRRICKEAAAVVVSVDYRLAPEATFPTAAEDTYAALCWVAANGERLNADTTRIAVGGESAGGNLATVAALISRDRGGPAIAFQVLISPVVGAPSDNRPSYQEFAEGYFLTRESMEWFFEHYPNQPADLDNPYLLPLRASDLSGLPPALVITAEYDVLRDEGEAYAARLAEAGVPCELVRYDGQIHGFVALFPDGHLSDTIESHHRVVSALRGAFAKN
jgi:acetyl esterase